MADREVYADKESAINRLQNNKIRVDMAGKLVLFNNQRLPGIKLWGAIDYLQRFHGYGWGKVK